MASPSDRSHTATSPLDPAAFSEELPPRPVFEPSLSYKALQWAKVVSLVFVGMGVFVMSLVLRDLHNQTSQDQGESACRSDIAAFHRNVHGQVGTTLAAAVLASFQQNSALRDTLAHQLEFLITVEVPRADDLNLRLTEICKDPPSDLSTILRLESSSEPRPSEGE